MKSDHDTELCRPRSDPAARPAVVDFDIGPFPVVCLQKVCRWTRFDYCFGSLLGSELRYNNMGQSETLAIAGHDVRCRGHAFQGTRAIRPASPVGLVLTRSNNTELAPRAVCSRLTASRDELAAG